MAKFGWCLTNLHQPPDGSRPPGLCPGNVGSMDCDCECHDGVEMWTAPVFTAEMLRGEDSEEEAEEET